MKNNKGLSYVELLIVIAVMALVTGFSALSMGLVSRTNAVKAGEKMVTTLKTARTYSLAKGREKGAFHIRKVGGHYECAVGDLADELEFETIGASPIEIYYYVSEDNIVPIAETSGTITIKFEQSNGAVVDCNIGSSIPKGFKIYKNDKPVSDIALYELTGKCELTLE